MVTDTAIKPLSMICFTTLNDRVGLGRVTGSKPYTGSGRVTSQKSWPGSVNFIILVILQTNKQTH